MKRITINKIMLLVLFIILFGGAMSLQYRQVKSVAMYEPYRDSLYLPKESGYVKLFTLGYDMFAADFLWLRSIQAFGGHWTGDRTYDSLYNIFNVITDLDPRFVDAYIFGNMVLGEEANKPELALKLIDKGIVKSLNSTYLLGYYGGYFSYWDYGDSKRASWYYTMSSRAKDSPEFINRIIGFMELKSGRYHVAFEKYLTDYMRSVDNDDELGIEISINKMMDVLSEWFQADLEEAVQAYIKKEGEAPKELYDLEDKGYISPTVTYDINKMFLLTEELYQKGEKLQPHIEDILKKIKVTYNGIPPEPHQSWYFLNPKVAGEGKYVVNAHMIHERMKDSIMPGIRRRIDEFYAKEGRFPENVDEFLPEGIRLDPFDEPWVYNPETGEIKCSTFDDL